jgi:Xaa-Pro aminopeptidase
MPHPQESVGKNFALDGMLTVRQKTIAVVSGLAQQLKEGMSEPEARKQALTLFADHGIKKHWHQPYVRFGKGTLLTYENPLQPDYRLKAGDPISIDVGPVWKDPVTQVEYEGDYGDTFVLGENPQAELCAQHCRELFAQGVKLWRDTGCTGKHLYEQLKAQATQMGYDWVSPMHGHRLGDFPHQLHSKSSLADVDFMPAEGLWVLEIQIAHPELQWGAFFEDLLLR